MTRPVPAWFIYRGLMHEKQLIGQPWTVAWAANGQDIEVGFPSHTLTLRRMGLAEIAERLSGLADYSEVYEGSDSRFWLVDERGGTARLPVGGIADALGPMLERGPIAA